jgi:hypothetical protein
MWTGFYVVSSIFRVRMIGVGITDSGIFSIDIETCGRCGGAVAESAFSQFNQQGRERVVTAETQLGIGSRVFQPGNGRN